MNWRYWCPNGCGKKIATKRIRDKIIYSCSKCNKEFTKENVMDFVK